MSDCAKLEKCPFFGDRLAKMPGTAAMMKENFCHNDGINCARLCVSSSGISVPEDLYPSQSERARQLITGHH